ncbi:hypothetical protein ACIQXF_08415 [Lysinibacillus sp. NPDC097231]
MDRTCKATDGKAESTERTCKATDEKAEMTERLAKRRKKGGNDG